MHTKPPGGQYLYKCSFSGCTSSFSRPSGLDEHLRIHKNDLADCAYCPYRYVKPFTYKTHLNVHFEIREFECDQHDRKFTSLSILNEHYHKHEGIIYNCLICNAYETVSRQCIESHLRRKHADIVGRNIYWDDVQHHIKKR